MVCYPFIINRMTLFIVGSSYIFLIQALTNASHVIIMAFKIFKEVGLKTAEILQDVIAFTYRHKGLLVGCKYRTLKKRFWTVNVPKFSLKFGL